MSHWQTENIFDGSAMTDNLLQMDFVIFSEKRISTTCAVVVPVRR